MEERMNTQLARRRREGSLRQFMPLVELQESTRHPDFSSNDYLGLAHCREQQEFVERTYHEYLRQHDTTTHQTAILGATGSRLLSGDSVLARELEDWLARLHGRPAALLCNSGYDANLAVLSSIPLRNDVVLLDELCHNSLVMGLRSSRVGERHERFRHNDVTDLLRLLEKYYNTAERILIVVESVYSMDGDFAPLEDILMMAQQYKACVVVDEAHGLGIYGSTNPHALGRKNMSSTIGSSKSSSHPPGGTGVLGALQLESHPSLLCSVHTFGKAAGAHGAVICGSQTLKDYLINYGRPLVYSTALPTHSLIAIQCAYMTMTSELGETRRQHVFGLVQLFRRLLLQVLSTGADVSVSLWPSPSPIQALVVRGNETCVEFCRRVRASSGILLFPIRAPTVARGQERVRIILHAHNTESQVRQLVDTLCMTLRDMALLKVQKVELPSARL